MMNIPYLDDTRIDALLDVPGCVSVLDAAFDDLCIGRAAVQARHRSDCGAVKLSTMGALWPQRQVAGVKAYTTVGGSSASWSRCSTSPPTGRSLCWRPTP